MSFGYQSEVHKHLFPKHPLFSHSVVEDNAHPKSVEPVQDEGLHLIQPLTKREEPTRINSRF
jgi:hypothetical protein